MKKRKSLPKSVSVVEVYFPREGFEFLITRVEGGYELFYKEDELNYLSLKKGKTPTVLEEAAHEFVKEHETNGTV